MDIFIKVLDEILKSCAYVFPDAMGNSESRSPGLQKFICWLILIMKMSLVALRGK